MSNAELKWIVSVCLVLVSAYGLYQDGRRRGWI